ncbi:S8 family serine peptidase [bacterium]|nr:S8 family serine peptidase [bacterium]
MMRLSAATLLLAILATSPAESEVLYNDSDISEAALTYPKAATAAEGDLLIVEPSFGVSPDVRANMKSAGLDVIAYIPRGAFLVRVASPTRANEWLRTTRTAMTLQPEWKIQPELHALSELNPELPIQLVIGLVEDSSTAEKAVLSAGGRITNRSNTPGKYRLGVTVPAGERSELLASVSAERAVYTIEPGGSARLLNDNASPITQAGSPSGGRPIWDRGIHGEGQIIAILDTGLDPDNCYHREADMSLPPTVEGTGTGTPDLTRRTVIIYDFLYSGDFNPGNGDWDSQNHGTWVAGNALGAWINNPLARNASNGMAPLAQLIVQDGGYAVDNCGDLQALGCPVVDLTPFLDQAVAQGANIHNNSWGDRENYTPHNTYTFPTADMDDATWRNPEFLIFCAAGNDGPASGSVGSPSTAKNVVAAGATESPTLSGNDYEDITTWSSRGPTSDGRIKPDLTAPGQTRTALNDDNAVSGNCETSIAQGTSMASPVSAGSAALVRQYFTEGWYPTGTKQPENAFTPSAALIKATLLAGAVNMTSIPIGGFPPNKYQGWGRIHLENSLQFEGDDRQLIVVDERRGFADADGPADTYYIDESSTAVLPTRIMLVWSDYPADPAASLALVNDLDLTVINLSDGTTYRGNNYDAATGLSQPGGDADRINNVEGVTIPAGTPGIFAVQVTAETIVYGPQGYAIAISGSAQESDGPAISGWTFR